jgi:hypothetical protein
MHRMVPIALTFNRRVKNAQKVRKRIVITWEGKPANVDVDGAAMTPRIGVVVVPKRRRDFGRNTPLTFRDLFRPLSIPRMGKPVALGN